MGRVTYRGKEKSFYDYIASLLSHRLFQYESGEPSKKLISLQVVLFSNISTFMDGSDDDTLLTKRILPLPITQQLLLDIRDQGDACPEGAFAKEVAAAFLTPNISTLEREEHMARVFDWIVKEEAYNNNFFMDEEADKIQELSGEKGIFSVLNETADSAEYENMLSAFRRAHEAVCHEQKVALVREMKDAAMCYLSKKGGPDAMTGMVLSAKERLIFAQELISFSMDFELDPQSSDYQIAMGNIIGKRDDYVKEEIIDKLLDRTRMESNDPTVRSFLKYYFTKDELLRAMDEYEKGYLKGNALKAFYDVANYTNEQQIRRIVSRPVAYLV